MSEEQLSGNGERPDLVSAVLETLALITRGVINVPAAAISAILEPLHRQADDHRGYTEGRDS